MQEKNSALIGNLACFTAYAIFGFNIISCKNIAIDGKERITWSGIAGIVLSLVGVIILIFNCVSIRSGADSTSIWGILGMIANTLCFASYVGIFKPLIQKYSVVTFMKWMFPKQKKVIDLYFG